MRNSAPFWHMICAGLVLAAYVTLSLTGHDATPVLTVLGGQGIGAGIQAGTNGK